jgi:hypothetical protein
MRKSTVELLKAGVEGLGQFVRRAVLGVGFAMLGAGLALGATGDSQGAGLAALGGLLAGFVLPMRE